MIIGRQARYLFVELPHTASSAISSELQELYGGEPILRKHAKYHEFLAQATPEERTYFVFSGIRNPLDEAVSFYLKIGWHVNMSVGGPYARRSDRRTQAWIRKNDADFPTYLRWYHRLPYDTWSRLSHRHFDFLIRFEHLQNDFATLLRILGLKQVRPLPIVNVTDERHPDDLDSWDPPEVRQYAVRRFGPYMHRWGYEFPASWDDCRVPWTSTLAFVALGQLRRLYWRYIKYNRAPWATWVSDQASMLIRR